VHPIAVCNPQQGMAFLRSGSVWMQCLRKSGRRCLLGLHKGTGSAALEPRRRALASSASPYRIDTFGVVGCGQMGTGIAIVAAGKAGLNVFAFDQFPASIERSRDFVNNWTTKEIKKGRMTEAEGNHLRAQIQYRSLDDPTISEVIPNLDFVVEAVTEEVELKRTVYKQLQEAGLRTNSVLATNTSSISITRLAKHVERPERVIGMHFMNPVPIMPLVEVIRGLRTDDEAHAATLELCTRMGKEHGTSQDRPGFIANRILMHNINAAIYTLQEGIGTKEDIDKIMKLGTNVPMGPLTLADFIGLDTCLNILRVLHEELGESYRPAPLLVNYVEAGWHGVKTKRGFYGY